MDLKKLLLQKESLVCLDIGSTSLKMLTVDPSSKIPEVLSAAVVPFGEPIFKNNLISKPDLVAEKLSQIIQQNNLEQKRAVITLPSKAIFTKIVKLNKMSYSDLESSIELEAGRYVPDSIESVKIDFCVLGENGKNHMDVLIVAIKNDILDNLLDCLSLARLNVAVVDIDYFALQNAFEVSYPDKIDKPVALINIGARFTSVNICSSGRTNYTGTISLGGNIFTQAISDELSISLENAERMKRGYLDVTDKVKYQSIIDEKTDLLATEFNRQLSLFWNASGIEDGIDNIYISGGGALIKGLASKISQKTGIDCSVMNLMDSMHLGDDFDKSQLQEIEPLLSLCIGMSTRQPGDKSKPQFI